jgi:hypothetical protein
MCSSGTLPIALFIIMMADAAKVPAKPPWIPLLMETITSLLWCGARCRAFHDETATGRECRQAGNKWLSFVLLAMQMSSFDRTPQN